MRYVRFRHRRQRFTSLPQINIALRECVERINSRPHFRFGVSRRERFERVEKVALKSLPAVQFDVGEWKDAKPGALGKMKPAALVKSGPDRFQDWARHPGQGAHSAA